MTVREWLLSRSLAAPAPLTSRMLELLGHHADAPAGEGATVFLDSARATLASLLRERRFTRDGALDLLAVDALMTFAYEHAAERGASAAALETLALDGAHRIAHLATDDV